MSWLPRSEAEGGGGEQALRIGIFLLRSRSYGGGGGLPFACLFLCFLLIFEEKGAGIFSLVPLFLLLYTSPDLFVLGLGAVLAGDCRGFLVITLFFLFLLFPRERRTLWLERKRERERCRCGSTGSEVPSGILSHCVAFFNLGSRSYFFSSSSNSDFAPLIEPGAMASVEVAFLETPPKTAGKPTSEGRVPSSLRTMRSVQNKEDSQRIDPFKLAALDENDVSRHDEDEDSPYSGDTNSIQGYIVAKEEPSPDSVSSPLFANPAYHTDSRWSDTKSSAVKKVSLRRTYFFMCWLASPPR